MHPALRTRSPTCTPRMTDPRSTPQTPGDRTGTAAILDVNERGTITRVVGVTTSFTSQVATEVLLTNIFDHLPASWLSGPDTFEAQTVRVQSVEFGSWHEIDMLPALGGWSIQVRHALQTRNRDSSSRASERSSSETVSPFALAPKDRGESPGRRVLCVDDEEMILRIYRRLLGVKHQVVTVSSVAEAITTLNRDPDFDLILCDLSMPDDTGDALYEHVRLHHQELLQSFVIVTGGALTPETEAFLNSVPVLVTHKPFRARHLREVLADFLGDP